MKKKRQCCFGIATKTPCKKRAVYVSTFKGERTKLMWCGEHVPQSTLPHGITMIDPIKPLISDKQYAKLGPRQLDELGDDE